MDVASWWGTQNWGSVPDWFAAVGTVGALFLGLLILVRERTRTRREAADSFVTWWVVSTTQSEQLDGRVVERYVLVAHAYNAGSGPVPVAFVYSKPKIGDYVHDWFQNTPHMKEIAPQEKLQRTIPFSHEPDLKRIFVRFTDSRGQHWTRGLWDNRYYSMRQAERKMRSNRPPKLEV
jgi:hypothetical protein